MPTRHGESVGSYSGIWDCCRVTWRREGLLGLYKGLVPAMLKVTRVCRLAFFVPPACPSLALLGSASALAIVWGAATSSPCKRLTHKRSRGINLGAIVSILRNRLRRTSQRTIFLAVAMMSRNSTWKSVSE